MAKKKGTVLFKLMSAAGTGFFYVGEKNTRFEINFYLFFSKVLFEICSEEIDSSKI